MGWDLWNKKYIYRDEIWHIKYLAFDTLDVNTFYGVIFFFLHYQVFDTYNYQLTWYLFSLLVVICRQVQIMISEKSILCICYMQHLSHII